MLLREKHTEGFTLAELLLTIAIILVLATIAIPSIVTAQSNMRMVELNNAAESIANAAQTQMTAKKVSGTWFDTIEKKSDDGTTTVMKYDKAINLPTGDPDDTYFMTATQAQQSGILTGLAIDDTVLNGDYIIEFTKSTANVVSVFYTDGKAGFFGTAPQGGNGAAEAYYKASSSREPEARRSASPMIGYYQGTPSAATSAVALVNPAIWVDEKGRLCIQDSNLTENASLKTTTEVTLSLKNADGSLTSLTIAGLNADAGSYTVTSGNSSEGYSNSDANTKAYELTTRDVSVHNDVFVIDLNDLKSVLKNSVTAPGAALATVVETIATSKATLDVEAKVVSAKPALSSIPATAQARIQWPEKVATLTVLVTNPALDAKSNGGKATAAHISGTYNDPVTTLVTDSGSNPVTGLQMKEQQATFDLKDVGITTNSLLEAENVESSRQSYSGGWVKLADAVSQTGTSGEVNVYAQVEAGSYTSDPSSSIDVSSMINPGNNLPLWSNGGTFSPSGKTHAYQIYEIWVNGERAGYLKQGEWTWEATELGKRFQQCVDPITSDSTEVKINLSTLYQLVSANVDGYEVYVRTTPKASEVKTYFTENIDRIKDYFVNKDRITGMRGVNLGAPIRQPFENEFGASSTVSLYNITSATLPVDKYNPESVKSDGNSYFVRNDIRIYYSATTALAWKGGSSTEATYTEAASAQLWSFKKNTTTNKYENDLPDAYVVKPRIASEPYSLANSTSADFELSTQRDGLFYRILEYCDKDGNRLPGTNLQYVPYTVQEDETYAKIAEAPAKEGSKFVGWIADNASTWPAKGSVSVAPNSVVSDYDAVLKYGYVKLKAKYEEEPKPEPTPTPTVGLMYLEFDANNGVSGWYGSVDGKTIQENLLADNNIATWGKYVVVPSGSKVPWYQADSNPSSQDNWHRCPLEKSNVSLGALGTYDVYSSPTLKGTGTLTPCFKEGDATVNQWNEPVDATPTYRYACTMNFAAAIMPVTTAADAPTWGSVDNPWIVRHADQFIGCLDVYNVQGTYLNQAFAQTHDIDMSGKTVGYSGWTFFTGAYDGGGYEIQNFRLQPDRENGQTTGLFRAARKATFTNINLVDVDQTTPKLSDFWSVNVQGDSSVGILIGTAEGCQITDCSVKGKQSEDENVSLALYITTGNNSSAANIGALAGKTSGFTEPNNTITQTVIQNCAVQDISLEVSKGQVGTAFSDWEKLNIGGVVGSAADTRFVKTEDTNADAFVKGVQLNVGASKDTAVNMGSLVGSLSGGKAMVEGVFTRNLAQEVSLLINAPEDATKLSVGAIIGFADPSDIPPEQFAASFDKVFDAAGELNKNKDAVGNARTAEEVLPPEVDNPVVNPGTGEGSGEGSGETGGTQPPDPVVPETPETPDTPTPPVVPETPETPVDPSEPEKPVNPESPDQPTTGSEGNTPVKEAA